MWRLRQRCWCVCVRNDLNKRWQWTAITSENRVFFFLNRLSLDGEAEIWWCDDANMWQGDKRYSTNRVLIIALIDCCDAIDNSSQCNYGTIVAATNNSFHRYETKTNTWSPKESWIQPRWKNVRWAKNIFVCAWRRRNDAESNINENMHSLSYFLLVFLVSLLACFVIYLWHPSATRRTKHVLLLLLLLYFSFSLRVFILSASTSASQRGAVRPFHSLPWLAS